MWNKWDKKYVYTAITAVVVIAIWQLMSFTLSGWEHIMHAIKAVNNALYPVYIGLIIAYLLNPIMKKTEKHIFLPLAQKMFPKKKGMKDSVARGTSIIVVMILALLLIYGLFMLVIPELGNSITVLINNLPSYYNSIEEWLAGLSKNHPEMAEYAMDLSQEAYLNLQKWLRQELLPSSTEILATVSGSLFDFVVGVFDIFIGIIISIYLLANKELFLAQARKMIYSIFSVPHANNILEVAEEVNHVFAKFISGKLIDSILVGIITFLALEIFAIPYASLISVIIGVTNIIPFFGQYIGIVPSAFLVFLVNPVKGIVFLIIIIIIMQFDGNIMGPKILGESIGLGSFWILFSILIFGSLFGLLGMIVAVPVFAVLYRSVKKWSASRLRRKQLATDTEFYKNNKSIKVKTKE